MAELSSSTIYGSLLITGPLTTSFVNGGLRLKQVGGGNKTASLIELGDRYSTWSYGINFNTFYDDSGWKYRNSDYAAAINLDASGNLYLQTMASGAANAATPWGSAKYIKLSNNGNVDITGDVGIPTANRFKINNVNLNVVAGNGLTGGGDLTPGVTLTLGTPSTLTGATTNAVTTSSHTHAITLTPADVNAAPSTHALVGTNHTASGLTIGHFLKATSATQFGFGVHGLTAADVGAPPTNRTITAGNGLTGGGDLSADRTITLGTPGTLSSTTSNAVTTSSHTHALDLTGAGTSILEIQVFS